LDEKIPSSKTTEEFWPKLNWRERQFVCDEVAGVAQVGVEHGKECERDLYDESASFWPGARTFDIEASCSAACIIIVAVVVVVREGEGEGEGVQKSERRVDGRMYPDFLRPFPPAGVLSHAVVAAAVVARVLYSEGVRVAERVLAGSVRNQGRRLGLQLARLHDGRHRRARARPAWEMGGAEIGN